MADATSLELLETLVSFDTTSRESNLGLIAFVRDHLAALGVESTLVHDEEGRKANLHATLGGRDRPGIVLSGHTDVVPVDGQDWDTDPFRLVQKDSRLYGRGTCDMKGFIAVALAFAPRFLERGLDVPVHYALSYDEEVGCHGARRLIDHLNTLGIGGAICIVGEPTGMRVAIADKGKKNFSVRVSGFEAHSSLAPHAVNAVEYAAELIAHIAAVARGLAADGPFDEGFDVPHTTVHTGTIQGGTALNIVPRECRLEFEIRHLPKDDADAIQARIETFVRDCLEPRMQAVKPETGITIEETWSVPALGTGEEEEVVAFVKALAERNDHIKVAYTTEAGLFREQARMSTVICGPGDVVQAHKPNEYIALEQIEACERFMRRLMDRVCRS